MNAEENKEPLPCPFCDKLISAKWNGCDTPGMEDCGYWGIDCCMAHSHADTAEEAIRNWNTRATGKKIEQLQSELAALKLALSGYEMGTVTLSRDNELLKQRVKELENALKLCRPIDRTVHSNNQWCKCFFCKALSSTQQDKEGV